MDARAFPLLMIAGLLLAGGVRAEGAAPLSAHEPALDAALRARLQAADPAAGARTFERKCSQCHDGARDGKDAKCPNLWNVFGRKTAGSPTFDYSPAMKQAGRSWNYATLDYYLADTERAVPGRTMDFAGIPDARARADLIAYLRTLNDAPPPLP
ncbi:MAG: c-type cytochrome [Pseudomonadota bacterium]